MLTVIRGRSDSIALTKSLLITVWAVLSCRACPLRRFARQGRVAAPSVCFAVACILLAAAPTVTPCFRRWRRSSPLLLTRGGIGIPRKVNGFARGSPTRGAGGRKPD